MRKYPRTSVADDALLLSGVLWVGSKENWKEGVECFEQILRDYSEGNHAEGALYYLATLARWQDKKPEAERLYIAFLQRFPDSHLCAAINDVFLPQLSSRDNKAIP